MSDDKLLNALAAAARDDKAADKLDPRWDRYSDGTLSDEEKRQLIEASAARGEPANTEAAFRPFDEEFRARLVETAKAGLDAAADVPEPANTVKFEKRRRRYFAPVALAASLILAVGLLLMPRIDTEFAPLPEYGATLQGGSEFRSDPGADGTAVFQNGDRLELLLTPATAVEGAVTGKVLAIDSTGARVFDRVSMDYAPSGAVRITGHIGVEIPLEPGTYRLLVAVGRDGAVPTPAQLQELEARREALSGAGWQAWGFDLAVAPD